MRGDSMGLGTIHEDDELLDRLGRREFRGDAGLDGLLRAWTDDIDTAAAAGAGDPFPWMHRRDGVEPCPTPAATAPAEVVPLAPEPRAVRVRGSRALAIAGALVITMSGGGMAAALSSPTVSLPLPEGLIASLPIATSAPGDDAYEQVLEQYVLNAASRGDYGHADALVAVLAQHGQRSNDPSMQYKAHVLAGQVAAKKDESRSETAVAASPPSPAAVPSVPANVPATEVPTPSPAPTPSATSTETPAPTEPAQPSASSPSVPQAPSAPPSPAGQSSSPAAPAPVPEQPRTTKPSTRPDPGGTRPAPTGDGPARPTSNQQIPGTGPAETAPPSAPDVPPPTGDEATASGRPASAPEPSRGGTPLERGPADEPDSAPRSVLGTPEAGEATTGD